MDLRETLQAVDNVSGHAFLGRHSDTLQIGCSIPLAEKSAEVVFNLDEVLGGFEASKMVRAAKGIRTNGMAHCLSGIKSPGQAQIWQLSEPTTRQRHRSPAFLPFEGWNCCQRLNHTS
jgi:hypothetical protein